MLPYHTALRCLFLVAMHHGIYLTPEDLSTVNDTDPLTSGLRLLMRIGLKTKALRNRRWEHASTLGTAYPALVLKKNGQWMILVKIVPGPDGETQPAVIDPTANGGGIALMSRADFLEAWNGTLILCARSRRLIAASQPFGLRWFLPDILKNAAYFRSVATAAIMSNAISFSIPLMFQVLIDKVITHHSYQTLYSIIAIFLVLTLFDGVFGYVRQRLMLLTSNKIDASLASRTFAHLLGLPLHFFESNPVGVLNRHMQQTERIRHFLTGRLFQTLLDAATLPLLLVLLVFYSGTLTAVVLLFSALIALVIGLMVPAYRDQLNLLYAAEGERQSHVVETLHNIRAVKSLVLEGERRKSWDSKVAESVRRYATVGKISAWGSVLTSGLDKVMQISIIGLGAKEVFDGTLTVGALVAFNMLSGRVTGPLIQMVALINEYQEAMLSVRMLGTVMNAPLERPPGPQRMRPEITGEIEFDQISFTYEGSSSPALEGISLRIEPGHVIGVVGRSGSGKTTLTRLIQSIHTAQEGMIRLNGIDIRNIDLDHLRRSVGVVLQDNLLFRGTIRDNIAATNPDAPLAEVMEAARMAGADEFIDRLPRSYDTFVEENGSNFSGGQRQRIAIARALLSKPRLLIFDEATSALDPDSEAIIQENLEHIARNRTMIIISHRMSSLASAEAILVLERGKMVDFGPHHALLERCDIYRHLWNQQTRYVQ